MKVLVSITTTRDANWQAKIKEAQKLGLKEVAIFLTCLNKSQRQKFYQKIKKAGIVKTPFVHLRSDCSAGEVDYLIKEFGAKIFNIHSQKQFPLAYDLSKFKKKIYLENNFDPIIEEAKNWAGICLDVSHHEDKMKKFGLANRLAQDINQSFKKHSVGAWHLNAIKSKKFKDLEGGHFGYDSHYFDSLKEFDYCKKYKKHLPKYYIALELENSLNEQLLAKKYVEKILKLK